MINMERQQETLMLIMEQKKINFTAMHESVYNIESIGDVLFCSL